MQSVALMIELIRFINYYQKTMEKSSIPFQPSREETTAFFEKAQVGSFFVKAIDILNGREEAESIPILDENNPDLSFSYRVELGYLDSQTPYVELTLILCHKNGIREDIPKAQLGLSRLTRAEIQNGCQCYPAINFDSEDDQKYLTEINGALEVFTNF